MKYLIWSKEHHSWWQQNRHGYTPNIKEAGLFRLKVALEIVANARPGTPPDAEPEEYMIPVAMVSALLVNFDAPQMKWLEGMADKLRE